MEYILSYRISIDATRYLRARAFRLLALLVAGLLSSHSCEGQTTVKIKELPPPAKRFALLIGIGAYKDPGITPLRGPTHDVLKMKSALISYVGLDPKNVLTLTSDATDELDLPSKDNIIRKLNHLKSEVAGGLLIIGFSGHGFYKFNNSYLLTYDTVNGDIGDLTDTSMSISWLRRKLQTVNAKQIMLFLDACQDDPESGKGKGDNDMSPEFKAALEELVVQQFQASAILFATRPPERAYIDDTRYGFFTEALSDGLSIQAIPSKPNAVTLGSLIDYIEKNVPGNVRLIRNQRQEPDHSVNGYDFGTIIVDPSWVHEQQPSAGEHKIHFQRVGTVQDCAQLPPDSKIIVHLTSIAKTIYAPATCDVTFFVNPSEETESATVTLVNAHSTQLSQPIRTFDTRNSIWNVDVLTGGEATRLSAFDLTKPTQAGNSYPDFYQVASRRLNSLAGRLLGRAPDLQYLSRLEVVRTGMEEDQSLDAQIQYIYQSNSLELLSGEVTSQANGGPVLHLWVLNRGDTRQTANSTDVYLDLSSANYKKLGDVFEALALYALLQDALRMRKSAAAIDILREETLLGFRQLDDLSPGMKALESRIGSSN